MSNADDTARVQLGPFALDKKIGHGGMAEVWSGVHVRQKVPVAIKVVHAAMARDPAFVIAFRNEVLSVARLQHPRIITVLDQGVVDPRASQASRGLLPIGSPYLAMELASGGTLLDVPAPMPWPTLRACLLAVMDALAHAHARGVIHRDLKPNNVLLSTPLDARPGLKLSDFGLACPADRALDIEREEHIAGTPQFMAPEQFRGEWRDYGPWTDLYALGCMAYYFASGELPFDGTLTQLIEMHLHQDPPTPVLGNDLPRGLWPWIARLMNKDPRQRFDCVADAAWALLAMTADRTRNAGAVGTEMADALDSLIARATAAAAKGRHLPTGAAPLDLTAPLARPPSARAAFGEDTLVDVPVESLQLSLAQVKLATLAWDSQQQQEHTLEFQDTSGVDIQVPQNTAPPLPATWRREGAAAADLKLIGAGLGLYGVRSVPLVDRDNARDVIWNALRKVHEQGRAQVVVLRGASGHGKSRVAEWMCQRMHEVGGATVMRAVHGSQPGPGQGLGRMLGLHLGCSGLSRDGLLARLETVLRAHGATEDYEWTALAELVAPSVDATAPEQRRISFGSPRERHAVIRRCVERLSRTRPCTVWMDDVQWGGDALAFALHVLEEQQTHPTRALLLCTVQEEGLASQPAHARLLETLCATPGVRTVTMPPLTQADHRQLVGELLGLEGHLAETVAQRTAGNPLFAVQLVGDWVQRGVLTVGSRGFVLDKEEQATLPDNIHDVWRARLERLPGGRDIRVVAALEVAAVLGMHVDLQEWTEACQMAGAVNPATVVDFLVGGRLMTRVDGGLRFIHGMLRESIERSARESGALRARHAVAARVLEPRKVEHLPGVAERQGRHWLAAGMSANALAPLLQGADERFKLSEYAAAHTVLDLVDEAVQALDLPRSDERRGEAWVLRAQVYSEEGRYTHAREYAELADGAAQKAGWKRTGARANMVLGHLAYQRGESLIARQAFGKARADFDSAGDQGGVAQSAWGQGDAEYRLGDFNAAQKFYEEALALAQRASDVVTMAKALWGLGYVAMWRGLHDEARAHFERQLRLFDRIGSHYGRAVTYNALGEQARLVGRFADAAAHYRKSLEITEAIGAAGGAIVHLNLVMVLLQQRMYAPARAELDQIWSSVDNSSEATALVGGHGMQTILAGHEADWDRFDRHLQTLQTLLAQRPMHDPDTAQELMMAAEQAAAHGEKERSRTAYRMALEQWKALGRQDRVTEAERALRVLR